MIDRIMNLVYLTAVVGVIIFGAYIVGVNLPKKPAAYQPPIIKTEVVEVRTPSKDMSPQDIARYLAARHVTKRGRSIYLAVHNDDSSYTIYCSFDSDRQSFECKQSSTAEAQLK